MEFISLQYEEIVAISGSSWYREVLHGINCKFFRKHEIEYRKLGGFAWMIRLVLGNLMELKENVGLPLAILEEKNDMVGLPDIPRLSLRSIRNDP